MTGRIAYTAALLGALLLGLSPPVSAQVIERGAITVVSTGNGCTAFPPACAIFILPVNTASATVQVSGTFTGTLVFEATADGTNWLTVTVINMADRSSVTTTTGAGNFAFANTGFLQFRLRATAFASGRAEITATKGFSSAALIGSAISGGSFSGTSTFTGTALFADGTSGAPSIAFASEPTLGFWRSSAGNIALAGSSTLTGTFVSATGATFNFAGGGNIGSSANGMFRLYTSSFAIGSLLKVDALPTIASGFGTSPSVTAGSTPLAGSVTVGSGGVAATGLISFNGTAFPSVPFCVVTSRLTNGVQRASGVSTTQLEFTSSIAWTTGDVVAWICISSK